MAKRGRPAKVKTTEQLVAVKVDHSKLLKQFEQEQRLHLESFYKDLAKIKHQVDTALTHVGFMDECTTLGEAAFKAGRAFGPLDEANDRLEEMLDEIFENNDLDHWDDINN
jgi:hypothetical protein